MSAQLPAEAAWQGRRRALRRAQWVLLAVGALGTLALGVIGFARAADAAGTARSTADLLYLALQLFTLESGAVDGPLPWQLELARFLAPVIAVATAVRALAVVFRQELQELRARRRLRGHVVVCGLGRKGRRLARRYRAAGERVVAIERDEDNPGIELCRDAGVIVLVGDATEAAVLRRAGAGRARQVVAVFGNDGGNAAVVLAARELAGEAPGAPPLTAVAHLLDPELCAFLRERELMRDARDRFRLEFFNVYEAGAEALLDEIPPQADSAPHVVVVGFGHFGEAVGRRLVRGRSGGAGLRLTVVDHDPAQLERALAAFGSVPDCRLEACALDVRTSEFAAARFALDESGRPTASAVYVCLDGDGAALSAALALHRRLAGAGAPIAVRLEEESGLATLLGRATEGDGFGELHGFALIDRTCRPDRLLVVSREALAQAIHNGYLAQQLAAGHQPANNPSLVPWARLPESLRDSNRAQADDLGRKVAAIGCEIRAWPDEGARPCAFTAAEVERLAEMEHARFVEERERAGWRFAPGAKDLERRTSPYLVPWSELDEATREIDRSAVAQIPALLTEIGYAVVRVERELLPGAIARQSVRIRHAAGSSSGHTASARR